MPGYLHEIETPREEIGVGEQFLIGEPLEVLIKAHAQERQRAWRGPSLRQQHQK